MLRQYGSYSLRHRISCAVKLSRKIRRVRSTCAAEITYSKYPWYNLRGISKNVVSRQYCDGDVSTLPASCGTSERIALWAAEGGQMASINEDSEL